MNAFDFVAIGGGNTGLAAAYAVARAGRKVALVDRGPLGGLCSLAGCNPKKVLVRAAEVLDEVRRAGEHGITAGEVSIDWSRVWARKHSFTDPVPERTEESLRKRGIEIVRGAARFAGPDAIEVDGRRITAEGFAVATGSRPRTLEFPSADLVRTSDDVLELREPPKRMVVIGAGVVAFEFAHVFARLGTTVTMLLRSNRALSEFDPDFIEPVKVFTRSLGVAFVEGAEVARVTGREPELAVETRTGEGPLTIPADFVLNAAGRVAAVEDLDLERAGVEASAHGIVVDEFLRSPGNRRVFAGGDAHGRFQLSPVASYEGHLIARNFLEGDVERADYATVPRAVFTVPPLALAGLTEEAARKKGIRVAVAAHDMKDWKVYAIAGEPQARAKIVAEAGTGRILGAQLFGPAAGELIQIFAMALRYRVTVEDFRNMVFAYPTFASALESALPRV